MGFSPLDRPRLVPLEPQPIETEDGRPAMALRDPLGVIDGMAVISLPAYYVMAHFDGERTIADVERALALAGAQVTAEEIAALANQMAESGFIEGPAYRALHARAITDFRAAPTRPAICAGGAYPDESEALRQHLDGFLTSADGPGPLGAPATQPGSMRMLVAPHIDLARGGVSYAHAYKALYERCAADLFVVFGTAHASPPHLFTLTRKDYDTPLGRVATDAAVVDALAGSLGEDELFADELVHKGEHSCEFQMVWLRHLYPLRDIKVVPVLCSSISHLEHPDAETKAFFAALARAVSGRNVCYIAGADLAHVGPRYGDPQPPTPEELAEFARWDRQTVGFVAKGDALGFHRDGTRLDEKRRLCGVAPIYAAMRASGASAALLHYGQWSDGVDSVSYAACAG